MNYLMSKIRKFIRSVTITQKMYILTVFIVAIPLLALSSFASRQIAGVLLEENYQNTEGIAKILDQQMKGTYDDILASRGVLDRPQEEQVRILNEELQPLVDEMCRSFPGYGGGFYSKELETIVAYGPDFSPEKLESMADNMGRRVYEVRDDIRIEFFSTTRNMDVMEVNHPIFRDGQIIGHIWVNIPTDHLEAVAMALTIERVSFTSLMLFIGFLGSYLIGREVQRGLSRFAQKLRDDQDDSALQSSFRELNPIFDQVVTARVQLREERNFLEWTLNHLPEAILVLDPGERIVFANEAHGRLLGIPREEVEGAFFSAYLKQVSNREEDHQLAMDMDKPVITTFYETFRSQAGELIPVQVEVVIHCLDERQGVIVILHDLRQKRTLERMEVGTSIILNSVPSGVYIVDSDLTIREANGALGEIFGVDIKPWLGKSVIKFFDSLGLPWEDTLMGKGVTQGEFFSNKETEVLVHGHKINLLVDTAMMQDNQGQCLGWISIIKDITKMRALEKEISRADKLHLMAQLAAGIAHEVRNPLTTIRGFLQLFLERRKFTPGDRELYQLMIEEVDRANTIIRDFLSLSQSYEPKKKALDLKQLLGEAVMMLESQALLQEIMIIKHLEATPPVWGDESQLKQVILNLVKNAMEATPVKGKVEVFLGMDPASNQVMIRISDTGVGMEPEQLAKLGTPFYTTKEAGTGIGLMVCYRIVEEHGGTIMVTSQPGQGTEFTILLQVQDQADQMALEA